MKGKKAIVLALKILGGTIAALLLLLVMLILLLRLPSVQTYLTQKIAGYVTGKTHTKVSLDKIYIAFPKSVVIEKLYAEDTRHDTLVYLGKLKVNIDMMGLFKKKIEVKEIFLAEVNANIARSAIDSTFNFNFLIQAFSSGNKKKSPEVKSSPSDTGGWQIQIDRLQLQNIRGSFADGVGGTTIRGKVGALLLNMKSIDIRHLGFMGHDLALSDANVSIIQTLNNTSVRDSTVALLPRLGLDQIDLKRVRFLYENTPQGQSIAIHVGSLFVLPGAIDLNSRHIQVEKIELSESDGQITMRRNHDVPNEIIKNDIRSVADTLLAGWRVSGDSVSLHQINFALDMTDAPRKAKGVDYLHLGLSDVNLEASAISYSTEKIKAVVSHLSLREQSGFDLRHLSAHGEYNYKGAWLKDLTVITSHSQLTHSSMSVSGLDIVAKDVGALGIEADLEATHTGVEDILLFAPEVEHLLGGMQAKAIDVRGKVSGRLNNFTATNFTASIGSTTSVSIDGHVVGLPNALAATYDVEIKNANSGRADLAVFLKKLPASVEIPETFAVSGHVKGSLKDAVARLNLKTSSGNINLDAALRIAGDDTFYTAKVNIADLDLGSILKKKDLLGALSGSIEGSGHNISLTNMIADARIYVDSISFRKYTYHCLMIDACADRGAYDATVSLYDPNAMLDMAASFDMADKDYSAQLHMNIEGIDLRKTKLLDQDARMSAHMDINLRDSSDNINGMADIRKVEMLRGDNKYEIDSVTAHVKTDSGQAHLTIESDIVDADYQGTPKVKDLSKALTSFVNRYFALASNKDSNDIIAEGQKFKLDLEIFPHPLITEVLLPQMKNFDGATVNASFDNDQHKVSINLAASVLSYSSIKADGFQADIHTSNDSLKYYISFEDLNTGPVKLSETSLSGSLKDNIMHFLIDVKDSTGTTDKLLMAGDLTQPHNNNYALHIDNKKLLINNSNWQLSENNLLKFGPEGINVHEFSLNKNEQGLSARSISEASNAPIRVDFKSFSIGEISQIVESDTALLRGWLNGNVELKNLGATPAFTSDLTIDSVAYQGHAIGNISLKANNLVANKYEASLILTGADNNVEVNGSYTASKDANALSLKANIKKLNIQSVEPFTSGQIRRSKGYLSGTADISGPIAHPLINGDVAFRDASFNVAYINNYVALKNDHIKIDPQGVYFNSFTILDTFGHTAKLDGSVKTTDFRDMKFNLTLQTDKFTALNTTIEDNPLYFGRVQFSSRIRVTGDESLPIVNGELHLLDATNLAVIIPSSKISVDRGDGVVVVVNHNDTTGIMGKRDTLSTALKFKGISVSANLAIEKKVTLKLIIDKNSGDSLVVHGEGRLSFSIDASGNQNMTGTYTLSGGSYDATLEKVIHKHFSIKDGSSITWNGRPEDAVMNVSAIYSVRTAPADLLTTETAGLSEAERSAYNKPLNFDVYLTVKGELLKPEISFKLDMADKDKAAFGGIVYSKVQSVNEDVEELNKQVFSLLILNKFMPTGTGGGGSTDYGGVATDLARNSVNQILADQLNKLSGKYIKGVDLNFGLQSNDEYTQGGVQQNTQVSIGLKKEFFKDRLGVQLGTSINVPNSNTSAAAYNSNSITGDILLDYKLTPDGRFHFKAFRLNQYEGIIDGLLYKTGVSVLYNKDYNTLKELFARHAKKQQKEKEVEK